MWARGIAAWINVDASRGLGGANGAERVVFHFNSSSLSFAIQLIGERAHARFQSLHAPTRPLCTGVVGVSTPLGQSAEKTEAPLHARRFPTIAVCKCERERAVCVFCVLMSFPIRQTPSRAEEKQTAHLFTLTISASAPRYVHAADAGFEGSSQSFRSGASAAISASESATGPVVGGSI